MSKKYEPHLISMSDITERAKEIAILWVENYQPMGYDLPGKHKLASDIMNYANEDVILKIDEIIKRLAWHLDNGAILDETFIRKELESMKPHGKEEKATNPD